MKEFLQYTKTRMILFIGLILFTVIVVFGKLTFSLFVFLAQILLVPLKIVFLINYSIPSMIIGAILYLAYVYFLVCLITSLYEVEKEIEEFLHRYSQKKEKSEGPKLSNIKGNKVYIVKPKEKKEFESKIEDIRKTRTTN